MHADKDKTPEKPITPAAAPAAAAKVATPVTAPAHAAPATPLAAAAPAPKPAAPPAPPSGALCVGVTSSQVLAYGHHRGPLAWKWYAFKSKAAAQAWKGALLAGAVGTTFDCGDALPGEQADSATSFGYSFLA